MALHSINLPSSLLLSSPSRCSPSSLPLSRSTHLSPPLKTNHLSIKPTRLHSTSDKNSSPAAATIVKNLEEDHAHDQVGEIADRWREIHGQNNWDGLLEPIDPLLRSEVIRYGEFVQACYDSYDFDIFSQYCGSCKYGRRHFFESLGMASLGYDVTRYLYATANFKVPKFFMKSVTDEKAWSERGNWIGYIAVSNDVETARLGRRDIVVAWRGTVNRLEWVADLMDYLRPVKEAGIVCPDPKVKVESGFISLYTEKDPSCRFCKYSAREQVLTEVRKLVNHYAEERGEEVSVSVMGHSLGSALATLSAYDMAESGAIATSNGKKACVTIFSFAGPRVGNRYFKDRFEQALGLKALRIVNVHDMVPKVPGMFINEEVHGFFKRWLEQMPWSYSHVGVELELDHKRSPFLKESNDVSDYHNMEAYLHLVDGYHGRNEHFETSTGRDPALVNKSCGFLKENLLVPPIWRQDFNKGMIRGPDGRWMQPERQKLQDHPMMLDDLPHPHDMDHHLDFLGLQQ